MPTTHVTSRGPSRPRIPGRRRFGGLAVALAIASSVLAGCRDGPVEDGQGGPGAAAGQHAGLGTPTDLLEVVEAQVTTESSPPLFRIDAADIEAVGGLEREWRIRFETGTSVPDDEASKLDEVARRLARVPNSRVDLVGCTDPAGSERINARLSLERAEAVAESLRELGVGAGDFGRIEGRGEACSVQERIVRVTVTHEVDVDASS